MPTSQSSSCPPHTIVVFGGGFAGRAVIHSLLSHIPKTSFKLILVDHKPFFEFTPSIPRCIVHPHHTPNITFPHDESRTFSFVHASVVAVHTTHVSLRLRGVSNDDGKSDVCVKEMFSEVIDIHFDFCVWAAGVQYNFPIHNVIPPTVHVEHTLQTRIHDLYRLRDRILAARHILLVGAGPVGVEMAAEIANFVRDSNNQDHATAVTLAASPRNGLLSRLPPRAARYATRHLTAIGVRIILRHVHMEKAQNGNSTLSDTNTNDEKQANNDTSLHDVDLVFDCTGAKPCTQQHPMVLGGIVSTAQTTTNGRISVTNTLQLQHHPHIFVVGDAAHPPSASPHTDTNFDATAYIAEASGKTVAQNLTTLIKGRNDKDGESSTLNLRQFPRHAFPFGIYPRLFLISLYKFDAVLCIGPVVLWGAFPALLKARIEQAGVAAARGNKLAAIFLGVTETVSYTIANVIQWIAWRFSSRGRRRRTVLSD